MAHNGVEEPRGRPVPLRLVVLLGALSGFAPLSIDMYLPGLPALQHHFGASASAAQSTLTGCLLGLALSQVVIGPVSDRIGRRPPLLVGVAAFVLASIGCALAPDLVVFSLLRFVQGAAGAAGIVISRAIVRDLASDTEAVRLFALLQVVNGVFPALAPVIGAQLLRIGSWRTVFVVLAAIGLVLFVASVALLEETNRSPATGSGQIASTLRTFALLARDREFVGYTLVAGFVFGAMFSYIAGSPFVLENLDHLSPALYSAVFATNAVGIVGASQLASALATRLAPARLLTLGVCWAATGALALSVSVLGGLGLPGVLPSLFVLVSAVGIVLPSATGLAMAEHPETAGSASGLLGVSQFLIGAACAPIVGAFGTRSALPMAMVIAALAGAALLARIGAGGSGWARGSIASGLVEERREVRT